VSFPAKQPVRMNPPKGAVVSLRARAPSPTKDLLEGLVARRPEAVAELFDRYAPAARGMLVRMLGDSADVDDLIQETFLVVVHRASVVQDPDRLRSFVVGVAVRLARNALRKQAVRRWIGLGDVEDLVLQDCPDPVQQERIRHLYRAFDRLDASSRTLLILRDVEGLELTELAEVDRCSLATLNRRLARARKRFAAIVAADPVLKDLSTEEALP
jgi:RNA polymerase sigma-70 factor, ECF subfamily